ncbi:MAG TPA: hypothetical protein VEX86_02690 [Longimicrobium sp.]|nr:hypothetical protein [Longimicrobium sp.]
MADGWARENPDRLSAVVFPDEGHRYQDTVYDDAWLEAKGLRLDALPRGPVEWERPHDGDDPWAFHRWGRREYAEVMGSATLELVRVKEAAARAAGVRMDAGQP